MTFLQLYLLWALPLVLTTSTLAATSNEIAQAIHDLGANEYKTREAATHWLWQTGRTAISALELAAKSRDPEVSVRAEQLLASLRLGIGPDTPANVRQLLQHYPAANENEKLSILDQLSDLGSSGVLAAANLLDFESNDGIRSKATQKFRGKFTMTVIDLVGQQKFDAAEAILATAALFGHNENAYGNSDTTRRYSAFLLLTGRLEAKIRELERGDSSIPPKIVARFLSVFYRAAGDLATARRYAEQSDSYQLLKSILAEQGDWSSVFLVHAKMPVTEEEKHKPEWLQLQAVFSILAGKTNIFDECVQQLMKLEDSEKDRDFGAANLLRLYPRVESESFWGDNILDPHRIHLLRARGFLERKDIPGTMREARICLNYLPADLEMPLALIPALDKSGHKKEADELYQSVATFLQKLISEFPKYQRAHQDLQKLSTTCNRTLPGKS